MLRNYFLINLLLITIAGFLGFELYKVISHPVKIPAVNETENVSKKDTGTQRYTERINTAAFNAISQKDLFRPSRTASSSSEEAETVSELPDNPPKLFGTIILNDIKTAILEDPVTKSTKNYNINDSVSGYVITDILEDKVIFSAGERTFEVKLRADKGIQPPRRVTRRQPVNRNIRRRTPRRVPRPSPTPPARTNNKNASESNTPEELEKLLKEMNRKK